MAKAKKVDLDDLSVKELREFMKKAERQLETRKKTQLKSVRQQVKQIIKDNGYTPADIFPTLKGSGAKTGATVAPKYSNPDSPEQTWTGRGRKPKWVEAHLEKGKKLEALAIK